MHLKLKILLLLLLIGSLAQASSMFTLSDVKKVYPVIEITTKVVPQEYKKIITEEIHQIFDELDIDYDGYDQRSFAILVNSMKIEKQFLITIELFIGEQVKRIDSSEKTFAATYIDRASFILNPNEELKDSFLFTLSNLLDKFSVQYEEENINLPKVEINEENFAYEMKYETSYEEAVRKAKKSKKNIMLLIVTNYCPWCKKFEQRVLLQKEVNKRIQKDYIPLILNKEKDKIPKKFYNYFSPVVHFIDYKTLESYQTVVGYNNKDDFLYLLKKGY